MLAFSGGLDTSFSIPYLKEKGYDVITVTVNTGGFTEEKLKSIEERAKELGAVNHYSINAEKEIFDRIICYLIKSHGLYQGIYPQMCSDRYIIAEKCVDVARKEGAKAVAHGCTAMGNDQVRFDISFSILAPDLVILAPVREFQKEVKEGLREKEAEYLEKRGFSVPDIHKRYTINENIFGTTISGSEIDENKEPSEDAFILTKSLNTVPDEPEYITITFENGIPVKLNNKLMSGVEIIKQLNKICGKHGCGRFIYTGDCMVGIKGRIAFEAPGIHALLVAHKALEEATLSEKQNQFKCVIGEKWAQLVFSGFYFEPLTRDIEKFLDENQKWVSGDVKLKVFKGSILPVEYSSEYLIRDKGAAYAQKASWRPEEAEAFIKLFGLPSKSSIRREFQKRYCPNKF